VNPPEESLAKFKRAVGDVTIVPQNFIVIALLTE